MDFAEAGGLGVARAVDNAEQKTGEGVSGADAGKGRVGNGGGQGVEGEGGVAMGTIVGIVAPPMLSA